MSLHGSPREALTAVRRPLSRGRPQDHLRERRKVLRADQLTSNEGALRETAHLTRRLLGDGVVDWHEAEAHPVRIEHLDFSSDRAQRRPLQRIANAKASAADLAGKVGRNAEIP